MSKNQSQSQLNIPLIVFGSVTAFVVIAAGIYFLLTALEPDGTTTASSDTGPDTTVNDDASGVNGGQSVSNSGVTRIDPPQEVKEFTFTSHTGEPLSLSDLSGKYVLMVFGYTHCPDVCPANLLEFRQIKRDLGSAAEQVEFVFVSVDPERDTPDHLRRYLQRYDPSFIGLKGDETELERIKSDYGLFWEIKNNGDSDAGYLVDHSASRFLINPDGELVRVYSFTTGPATIKEDIRSLL